MANENCLDGIKCPQCGNEDRFRIHSSTLADVTDDGAEATDIEWDDDSFTWCVACDKTGRLRDFCTPDLPPDPEGMNDRRAAWAAQAIATFRAATGTEEADAVCDLLSDLMHWCDRRGQDFGRELARARDHYAAETLGEDSTT